MLKKLKVIIILMTVAILLSVFLAGCAPVKINPAGASNIITDQLGRQVSINKIPQRIISLAPDITETLFALGLGDKVVGVTDYCDYPPEATQKEKIGGFSTPNIEKITSLAPDLIVAASIHQKQVIPELERRGYTVLALVSKSIEEVMEAIALLSRATYVENAGLQLVDQMKKRADKVTRAAATLSQKPRVFYVVFHDPLWTTGSGTTVDDLIQKSGGYNVAAVSGNGWITFSLEMLVAANPQVIIAGKGHGAARNLPFEWIKNESRLSSIDARKNGRIYQVDANLVTRPGPRIVDGLEAMASLINPEVFR